MQKLSNHLWHMNFTIGSLADVTGWGRCGCY